jgi:alkylhydroperoxidase family enzyme
MTQRLTGMSDTDATALGKEIIDAATMMMGRASNLVRILSAHSPFLARWFLGLVCAVRQPDLGAKSDVRLRSLATIKTSMVNQCTYCSTHTSMFGQALGLTQDELEALKDDDYRTSPLFSARDKAAIAWSEAMTRNSAARDEAAWDEVRRQFNDAEIVEISLACAMFNMINRLNDSLWTELEPPEYNRRQGDAVRGRTIEQIEDYAGRFAATGRAERGQTQPVAAE